MTRHGSRVEAEPFISMACREPAAQQAELVRDDYPRHPYLGQRPHWSGYCVIPSCACECHQAQAPDLGDWNVEPS